MVSKCDYYLLIQSGNPGNLWKLLASLDEYGEQASCIAVSADFDAATMKSLCKAGEFPIVEWLEQLRPWSPAREWNRLIEHRQRSWPILLVGDDVVLRTPRGLSRLAELAIRTGAIMSASVEGEVRTCPELRSPFAFPVHELKSLRWLPFICVAIPPGIWRNDRFDESFDGYGCEDHDYAESSKAQLFVTRQVVVLHDAGEAGRSVALLNRQLQEQQIRKNRNRFIQKWGYPPP